MDSYDYLKPQNTMMERKESPLQIKSEGFLSDTEFHSIHNDNIELSRMLTSSIKTLKNKIGKL